MDESKPYRKMPDADDPSVAWVFAGVDGDIIGDEGLAVGGAAGIEFDRYDLALGTPPHTRILASSEGHSDNFPLVVEDILCNYPGLGGTQDHRIRADMTYFTTREGARCGRQAPSPGARRSPSTAATTARRKSPPTSSTPSCRTARCRGVVRGRRRSGTPPTNELRGASDPRRDRPGCGPFSS